ncbi:uroporphyrinogen-III C-methyltransferase [Spongisporangium articulatum]|uniref:Uroporphyrinogen-III C-methyltransferase n=1 Tax=Spongisporangium articulatum TaxID=3362603 RepID=A0ABW8AKC6_9ACTN
MDTPYLAGLDLRGRRVVVVGGGRVAQRRLPVLLEAGARVELVSPQVTAAIEGMAGADEIVWTARPFAPGDLSGAWYAMALTDDAAVNAQVVEEASAARIFCVRADDAVAGTAATPATGGWSGLRLAVTSGRLAPGGAGPAGGHDPLRAAAVRDAVLEWLRSGAADRPSAREARTAGRELGSLPGVALVGGGPGDPELITVRGRRLLAQADVVVTDRLAPLALLDELDPDVEIVDATKLPRGRFMAQEAINACLVEKALEGKFVVRLKGGDPYVFGRGSEELDACVAAGVPVTVVPGLSSSIAVPGLAGIPLTHRGVAHEAVIVSGHLPPGHAESLVDWAALGRLRGTVVVLMGVQNLGAIAQALVDGGREPGTPVAVVQDGSMPGEQVTRGTLATIEKVAVESGVRAPAIIVVGGVVAPR